MTKGKKILALMMVIMMFATVGCSSKTEQTNTGAEETDTNNEAVRDDGLEHVNLTWYYIGNEEVNEKKVFDAANKIIKEKINATVEFKRYSFGEYPQKMQLLLSAEENIDILFTSNWSLNYSEIVSKGALKNLDNLIDNYMPKTKTMIPELVWDATRIEGNVYGVPNYQVSFVQPALIFKKDIVDKYDLKDEIYNVKKMSDLTKIFEVVKANEPEMFMTAVNPDYYVWDITNKDDYIETETFGGVPCGVNYDLEVINLVDNTDYQGYREADFELAKLWTEKGYFHPDASLVKDFTAEKQAGKFFLINDVYKPGVEADMKNRYGYDVYAVPMSLPVLSTNSCTATLTAISRTSKNPERAAMLIELMNTDIELYNLIVFGIEGEQYNKVAENRIELIPDSGYSGFAWMMGTQFNAYLLPGQEDDVWEVTKKMNMDVIPAPTLGFSFNRENVKTEMSNVISTYEELKFMTQNGLSDKESYIKLRDKTIGRLQDAGIETYMKELKSQIDEWNKTR